jgi:hypothetical protein
MSDESTAVSRHLNEANALSWGQFMSSAQGYEPWQMGFGPLGGVMGTSRFDFMSLYTNDPSIFLGIMQFAAVTQQRQWNLTVLSLEDNIRNLTKEMNDLREEIRQLCRTRTFVVPLTTLSPGPLQITKQIPVTIEGDGEEFTATFTEANISASGDTEADAIANFKDALVSSYQLLEEKPSEQLGPLPTRQWSVLQDVVKRTL